MDESHFLNKPCKLVKKDGFVLYGIPREITTSYVLFETRTKTSIIGFIDIKELSPDEKQRGIDNEFP
jgi:hypothetical protein